ncbi:MAG: hypothetical protein AVO39_00295 [delta proteobacterium MLS_D]|jgi:hypothetical protein|nr:MAG: hypothetical protein AVO39_00295 [delta proteobacterium MLS_D]
MSTDFIRRVVCFAVVFLIFSVSVAGCGKKGDPRPSQEVFLEEGVQGDCSAPVGEHQQERTAGWLRVFAVKTCGPTGNELF